MDLLFHEADRATGAADLIDLPDVRLRPRLELVGKCLDRPRAAQRIHRVGHAALRCQDLLRPKGEAGRILRRQGESFIVAVRVQRLRAAQHGSQRLNRHADDVVVRLLCGERGPSRLGVEAQSGTGLRSSHVGHDPRPESAGGAKLGDLFQEVVVRREEEAEAGGEVVQPQAGGECATDVLQPVRQREGDLLRRGRSSFPHVVAADRDRIPLRHFGGAEREEVRDEAQAGFHGINVGSACHELFEDVVLYGTAKRSSRRAALVGQCHVKRQKDRSRGVDRH